MYGYNQGSYGGYGSTYSSATAAAAAAVAYSGLGQSAAASQQQNPVFGSTTSSSPYASYNSSVAAAYGYGNPSSNAVAAASNAYAQVAQAQAVNRLSADYAAAAAAAVTPTQYNFGSGLSGYGGSSQSAGSTSGYGRGGGGSTTGSHGGQSQASHMKSSAQSNAANKSNISQYASSSYTNYDAAVFAAASSYLHSKASGTTNMWMSNKKSTPFSGNGTGGGINRTGFPKRGGFGNTSSGIPQREAQQFYCEVCKISCAGQLTYKEHLEGQRHKKKESLAKGESPQSLPKSKVSFRCDLCNVTCTGQDTYNAHVRGSKHQKTLALCKKLGKPIPSNEPTIIPPSELGGTMPPPPTHGEPIPTVGNGVKKVVGISTVNFVPGAKLSTTGGLEAKKQAVLSAVGSAGKPDTTTLAVKAQTEEIQALIAAEQNVQPVGEDYVEAQKDSTGKLMQYVCKLCDCKFSDPNAKEIHLKGRRHRLQYKMKVDPTLEVEVKPPSGRRGAKLDARVRRGVAAGPPPPGMRPMGPPGPLAFGARGPWFGAGPLEGRRFESTDDRHVQAKHTSIYPDDEQLTTVESLVLSTEKALKSVSDFFNQRDEADEKKVVLEGEGDAAPEAAKEGDRLLKGVMRVGLLSKGLLLKGDTQVDLVVLCSSIPTVGLLNEVASLIPQYYETPDGAKLDIQIKVGTASLLLQQSNVPITCHITLTSRSFREDSGAPAEGVVIPTDSLDRSSCLLALAQLRHAKWFQARCVYLQSCQITLRILREIRQRMESWNPLSDWMVELLVEKVLASCAAPLSIGDALRRVFEAISSGILLQTGPGLVDPCEKEQTDVLAVLTDKQRDQITSSAQHGLRLIAFNQLYKVLAMDRLPDVRPPLSDRKRPMEKSGSDVDDVKKDKKEGEDEPVKMEVQ